jgi:hypothetical protein
LAVHVISALRRLWRGELPLTQAFWSWTVIGALLVNATTTLAFLLLIMADWPIAALIANFTISVPYNIVAGVGVWRAAARYTGDPQWAMLARIVSIAGLVVLSVA